MYPFADPDSALERAADQLVDEIAARHAALAALAPTDLDGGRPAGEVAAMGALRAHASTLVAELTRPAARRRARAIVQTLWPQQHPSRIPEWWWTTPLGVLLHGALHGPPDRTLPTRRAPTTIGDSAIRRPTDSRTPADASLIG